MKKLALAAALASLSTLASANVLVNNGYYVQGGVGYSKLDVKFDDGGERVKDNDVSYTIAMGKDTGAVRYALDYTNYNKIKGSDSETIQGDIEIQEDSSFNVKVHSVGLSAIYDFDAMSGLTPYVGVRLGVNQLKANVSTVVTTKAADKVTRDVEYAHGKKTKVGVGALAGVQYAINPQLAVDAGVEYNHLGKIYEAKLHQYGAKVGLRYNF